MDVFVGLTVRAQDVARLKAVLSPKQFDSALRSAVWRTVRTALWPKSGGGVGHAVLRTLKLTKQKVDASTRTALSNQDITASLTITHNPLPITEYKGVKVRGRSKYGSTRRAYRSRKRDTAALDASRRQLYAARNRVSIQTRHDKPPLVFRHAFATWVSSSAQQAKGVAHYGVFERGKFRAQVKGLDTSAGTYSYSGGYKKDTRRVVKVRRRGKKWATDRLPIYELYGPSVYNLFARKDTVTKFGKDREAEIQKKLHENIDSQIRRFLKLEKDAPLPV